MIKKKVERKIKKNKHQKANQYKNPRQVRSPGSSNKGMVVAEQ